MKISLDQNFENKSQNCIHCKGVHWIYSAEQKNIFFSTTSFLPAPFQSNSRLKVDQMSTKTKFTRC